MRQPAVELGLRVLGAPVSAGLGKLALGVTALLAARAASGHEYWLSASRHDAVAGAIVEVRAHVGEGFSGEDAPLHPLRVRRLLARGAEDVDLGEGLDPASGSVFVELADDRGLVVACESAFSSIEIPAAEFEDYLESEGLDHVVETRARQGLADVPGRERYARCAKAWIAGRSARRVTEPLSLPFEIVPVSDPARSGVLRLRVLRDGRPASHVLVTAWRAASEAPADVRARAPALASARTDRGGACALGLPDTGDFLVSAVWMEPSIDPTADWQSYWASLTFTRAGRIRTR